MVIFFMFWKKRLVLLTLNGKKTNPQIINTHSLYISRNSKSDLHTFLCGKKKILNSILVLSGVYSFEIFIPYEHLRHLARILLRWVAFFFLEKLKISNIEQGITNIQVIGICTLPVEQWIFKRCFSTYATTSSF